MSQRPSPDPGHAAISAGAWGKGMMGFCARTEDDFDETVLELLVSDLARLGIGEEHFVCGITCAGRRLKGEIVNQGANEMYPVLWYDTHTGRWRQMDEIGSFDPTP